jgi:hypothetical protein
MPARHQANYDTLDNIVLPNNHFANFVLHQLQALRCRGKITHNVILCNPVPLKQKREAFASLSSTKLLGINRIAA